MLGNNPKYIWETPMKLTIKLREYNLIEIGDAITLKKNSLYPDTFGPPIEGTVYLEGPKNPIIPKIIISAKKIGPCEGFVLDARGTTGGALKPFKRIIWTQLYNEMANNISHILSKANNLLHIVLLLFVNLNWKLQIGCNRLCHKQLQ